MPAWNVAKVTMPDGTVIERATVVLAPDRMKLYVGHHQNGDPESIEKDLTSIVPDSARAWSAVDSDGGNWRIDPAASCCGGA